MPCPQKNEPSPVGTGPLQPLFDRLSEWPCVPAPGRLPQLASLQMWKISHRSGNKSEVIMYKYQNTSSVEWFEDCIDVTV